MIYIGNGMYSDSGPNNYLQHYGRKGMKWGQHIFGDEKENSPRYQKYLRSVKRGYTFLDMNDAKKNIVSYDSKKIKNKIDAVDVLRFDAMFKDKIENKKPEDITSSVSYIKGKYDTMRGREFNIIHHYKDKNGVVALSYANFPKIGDVYASGFGKLEDIDFKSAFKKPPKSSEIISIDKEPTLKTKHTVVPIPGLGVHYSKKSYVDY